MSSDISLGPVMAIEVERNAADRKLTRDQDSVQAVLRALGSPSSWALGGMPRCMPNLWARLVPVSGEGGATLLFCDASSPGYLFVPDHGSFVLPEETGKAVFALVAGLNLPGAGSVAPVVVTEHLDSLLLRVTIDPGTRASTGLRSVALARGHRLEPDAVYADGSPVSLSVELSEAQASAVVGSLALSGFFQRGSAYVTPATSDPGEPPQGRTVGLAPAPAAPAGWVSVTVTSGAWHHTWQESNAPAIFAHTVSDLGRTGLSNEVRGALGSLPPQLE